MTYDADDIYSSLILLQKILLRFFRYVYRFKYNAFLRLIFISANCKKVGSLVSEHLFIITNSLVVHEVIGMEKNS